MSNCHKDKTRTFGIMRWKEEMESIREKDSANVSNLLAASGVGIVTHVFDALMDNLVPRSLL